MDAQTLFQLAMLISGSSVLTAAVQAFINRRRVKVDATAVLSDTSLKQVDAMQSDLTEAKNEMRQFKAALYAHQRWDAEVLRRLNTLGVTDIQDPPELWI